ncbi:hypothetical protein C0J52_27066 [Blattella germanica]|nr:hypothetical protein C0J52_27066 [Blattella germanica]
MTKIEPSPSSRLQSWKNTTPEELYIFFALTILMARVKKLTIAGPKISSYQHPSLQITCPETGTNNSSYGHNMFSVLSSDMFFCIIRYLITVWTDSFCKLGYEIFIKPHSNKTEESMSFYCTSSNYSTRTLFSLNVSVPATKKTKRERSWNAYAKRSITTTWFRSYSLSLWAFESISLKCEDQAIGALLLPLKYVHFRFLTLANLAQFRHRITAAVQEVTADMFQRVWQEIEFALSGTIHVATHVSEVITLDDALTSHLHSLSFLKRIMKDGALLFRIEANHRIKNKTSDFIVISIHRRLVQTRFLVYQVESRTLEKSLSRGILSSASMQLWLIIFLF